MSKLQPDYSFVRDGISLREWLWSLVDDFKRTRIEAGEALQAMEWGLPSVHTDWDDLASFPDTAAQGERFAAALRETIAQDVFDRSTFFEKLGGLSLGLARDWLGRVDQATTQMNARDKKYDRIANRLIDSIKSAPDETERKRAEERLKKLTSMYVVGSGEDANGDPFVMAESLAPSGIAAGRIFQILDVEVLEAPAVITAFLNDAQLRRDALSILQRCGPAAVSWAPRLLHDFDRFTRKRGKSNWFDAAQALGSVGRGNPETVDAMTICLTHAKNFVRQAAADVLRYMAGEVCGRNDEICQLLLPMLDEKEEVAYIAVLALGSVGRNRPEIRSKILTIAAPQPPQLRSYPGYPHLHYDQTMNQRAAALGAIEYFTTYPNECLPVLIDALDTFVEFDPDECYHGPHARVSGLIALFGPLAEPAVLPLAGHLNDEPEEHPSAMLECLEAIGPAAGAALPELRKLREQYLNDNDIAVTDDPPDRDDDPIGWLIARITGELS
ncbi:HEAT repeat domain-containing protein [Blastopirellula retiformator]|uniref:HEAT repeat protein n=1 Tax=Blastopirellula retiformator TaxID=2527970 RepID=A0A5C5V2C8_9BACT|nr:HEAT repeat domain-containing protein [Blastopirellula retiformator]TWT31865.1 hypothetical protein Enr8_37900 [Blastopirellula retiformator]